jgi:hypothetical protein
MRDRVQVLVRGPKPLENSTERIVATAIRLGPSGRQLYAGDGIVTAADANAVTPLASLILLFSGATAVSGALTSAHGAQL